MCNTRTMPQQKQQQQQQQQQTTVPPQARRGAQRTSLKKRPASGLALSPMRVATAIACSLCLAGCLLPARPVECGRLQDFIQNLVGGGGSGSSSSSSSNSNKDSSSSGGSSSGNSNSDSGDSDTAASNDSNEQPLTPMMSAMNPFMRYPSFYDGFGPAAFGGAAGFPGMGAYSGQLASAMSAMSPMAAALSGQSLAGGVGGASGGASSALGGFGSGSFSPSSYSPLSPFGSFGASSSANPMEAFASGPSSHHFSGSPGMSASSLSSMYASTPSNFLSGAYTPYYGRRRR